MTTNHTHGSHGSHGSHGGSESQAPERSGPVAAADRLAALWAQAEQTLSTLGCETVLSHEVRRAPCVHPNSQAAESVMSLDWRQHQGRWRLCRRECVMEADICTWLMDRPVAKCPVDEQVVLAQHVGALRAKMEAEAERRCLQASEAIECLAKALAD